MSLALAEAAGRYGHVMFPSNLHPPAVQLSQYLLEKGPGRDWASRVFYSGKEYNFIKISEWMCGEEYFQFLLLELFQFPTKQHITSHKTLPDDGSTGMEVAIKMALRLWDTRYKKGLIKGYLESPDTGDTGDKGDLAEEEMRDIVVLTQKDCYHGKDLVSLRSFICSVSTLL